MNAADGDFTVSFPFEKNSNDAAFKMTAVMSFW